MIVKFGKCYTHKLNDENVIEVHVYAHKWITKVTMDVWTPNHDISVSFNQKVHINYERFLPLQWAEYLAKRNLNKQSQKVAGINIV